MDVVTSSGDRSGRGAARGGPRLRHARTLLLGAGTAGLGLALVLGAVAAVLPGDRAVASPTASVLRGAESTSATPTEPGNDQDQLAPSPPPSATTPVAPTIADPGDVTSAAARFRGTGTPGDAVRVADPAVPSASVCTTTVDPDGAWSCIADVHSGPAQVFTVFDTTNGALAPADSPAVDVIVPPSIAASGPTTGTVSGTGLAGATVTVTASSSGTARTTSVGSDGRWVLSFGSGDGALATGTWTLTATQTAGTALGYRSDLRSTASSPRTVAIDRTAPGAPVISSPAAGTRIRTQPITIAGSGEDGAVATAYIDANPVCQATVAGGTWSCSTAGESIPDGARSLVVGQRDAAGNFSPVSTTITVTVAGALTNGAPTAAPSSSGSTSTSPRPRAPSTAAPGASGTTPSTTAPNASGGSGEDGASSPGGPGTGTDPRTDWAVATAYDGAVPTIQSSLSLRTLALVLVGVVGFLALVAVPLKLVARSTRGRVTWRSARFTGRNRSAADRMDGDDAGMPVWAPVVLSVGIASVLMLLGTGIEAQARYARLGIAVLLGTAVLALGVVLASRWAAGSARQGLTYRISPVLLVAALVACVVTRTADLSPALLVGVLIVPTGPRAPTGATTAARMAVDPGACGRNATWRTTALLVLVGVGWALHSAISGTAHGFWVQLTSEFAITLCVGGLGSLVTALLPIAGTAGAALWSTSRARYATLASIGVALAVAVYSGPTGTHLPTLTVGTVVIGCAVVGLVTWTWVRVVEPIFRS